MTSIEGIQLTKTKIDFSDNKVQHLRRERLALADNEAFYGENPWITKLHFSFQDKDYLYLIMEFVPGGDMMTHLIKYDTFSEEDTRFYIAETMLALDSIHAIHYIHRYLFSFL